MVALIMAFVATWSPVLLALAGTWNRLDRQPPAVGRFSRFRLRRPGQRGDRQRRSTDERVIRHR
jgi:hypothetical protein